jgi:hypothetical protein
MTDTAPKIPFDHVLSPTEITAAGTRVVMTADEAARRTLADLADILDVETFRAELHVVPWSGKGFAVSGRVAARVHQACVVSLEPVETVIDETVDLKLVPPEEMAKYEIAPDESGDLDLDAIAGLPDPIEDGVIDLGAIAVEHFMLGLDPYPRKEGAVFDPAAVGLDIDPKEMSPFAALARLGKE